MKILFLPLFVLLIITKHGMCQINDSTSENPKQTIWQFYGQASLGYSNEKKSDSTWYLPRGASSFDLNLSRRVSDEFWITSGVGLDFYSIKSEPYNHVTITNEPESPGSGNFQPVYTVDNQETQIERRRIYLSVPILFEYQGKSKVAPYFKAGGIFSFSIYDRSRIVYVNSGSVSNYYLPSYNYISKRSRPTLFGSVGGGVLLRKERTSFSLGLVGNFGLFNFIRPKDKGALPQSILLEFAIRREMYKREPRERTTLVDEERDKKKNYVYISAPQLPAYYSLNYERSFILNDKNRINGRFGTSVHNYDGSFLPKGIQFTSFQLGTAWTHGRVHSLEVSFGAALYRGYEEPEYTLLPSVGYRFEPRGHFFGRVAFTPNISLSEYCVDNYGQLDPCIMPLANLSMGFFF